MPIHDWTRVDAGVFHDFHTLWLVALRNSFKHVLPSGYYAMTEQRILDYEVDILTLDRVPASNPGSSGNGASRSTEASEGGINLATVPPAVRFSRVAAARPKDQYRRRWIAVRHVSGNRVVAVVELVSPGNKSGHDALRSFTSKVAGLLELGVHALIIDPFPPTARDPDGIHRAIWADKAGDFALPPDKPLTLVSYAAGDPERAFIQPVAVGDPLPAMPLFLTSEYYVLVPLEESYVAAFAEVDDQTRRTLTTPPTPGEAHGT